MKLLIICILVMSMLSASYGARQRREVESRADSVTSEVRRVS